ncbi:MAG: hypothetical protein ABSA83_10430 [Verrucomicrobiota bacterium]
MNVTFNRSLHYKRHEFTTPISQPRPGLAWWQLAWAMKRSTLANVGSWLLIMPMVVASTAHGFRCYRFWGQAWFGNFYTDPVDFILSYLTPLAGVGLVSLIFLRRNANAKTWSVALATTVCLVFTLALMAFGLWCFHGIADL